MRTLDLNAHGEGIAEEIRRLIEGRGTASFIEAVDRDASGIRSREPPRTGQRAAALPDALGEKLMARAGVKAAVAACACWTPKAGAVSLPSAGPHTVAQPHLSGGDLAR